MLFVQPFFLLIFLPAAVALFYVAARIAGRTAALALMVLASAVFYLPYGALPAAILATSLFVNFGIGVALALKNRTERLRRLLLAIGLALNFGNLGVFKYLDQILAMVHPNARPVLAAAIPAGISFYTFHQAVFLVHAFGRRPEVVGFLGRVQGLRGRVTALTRYAAFVAFFPQLVIGPITYMSEFGPQAESADFARLRIRRIEVGAMLIVVGLFKKVVVADGLASLADPIYTIITVTPISSEQALLAIISYSLQLYFDFSGYSDMALGIAQLFGLRLPQNFDSPLRATGIVDFYRRWHMSLTRVVAALVFTPLSLWGARAAVHRGLRGWRARLLSVWIPLVLNFQIIALWHAAKFTLVAFGLIHGVWYVAETELRRTRAFRNFARRTSEPLRTVGGVLLTTPLLALTWALFRSQNLHLFWALLRSLGDHFQPSPDNPGVVQPWVWPVVALIAGVVYAMPNIYEILEDQDPAIPTFVNRSTTPAPFRLRWRPTLAWGLMTATLLVVGLSRINLPSPFLYAKF